MIRWSAGWIAMVILIRYCFAMGNGWVMPGWVRTDADGKQTGRCIAFGVEAADAPSYCGILQGYFGRSTVFKESVMSLS